MAAVLPRPPATPAAPTRPQTPGGGLDRTMSGPRQTARQAYQLDQVTPPKVTGRPSWLGVNPSTRMSTALAREGLQGYLGGDLTPHMGRITQVLNQHGYTDPTFQQDLTGAQYNALLQAGAEATGATFTPWSTTALEGTTPVDTGVGPGAGLPEADPVPELTLPEYQRPDDFRFTPADLANDRGYQFEFDEGMRALTNSAAARGGVRGTNQMRDFIRFGQGLAATGLDRAYGRAADTYDRNVGTGRYAHEAETSRQQTQFAPRLLEWERNRDERRRDAEMQFDRDWQREQYGREDAWRRHVYQNDDLWRRYQLEEQRRQRLAEMGLV